MELMLKNSMKRLHLTGGFAARMQWDGPSDPPPDHPSVLADVPALSPSLVGPANGGNRTHAGPKDHPVYRETNGFWMFLASQDKKKSRTSIKSSCFRNLETRNHLQLSSVVYSNMQQFCSLLSSNEPKCPAMRCPKLQALSAIQRVPDLTQSHIGVLAMTWGCQKKRIDPPSQNLP